MKEFFILSMLALILSLINKWKKREGQGLEGLKSIWESDFRIVIYTFILLLVLNPMFKYMTSSVPEIWDWYWNVNNHLFFVFFNVGWLAYAFFTSKRDEKDKTKPVPEAQKRATVILWSILIFTIINLAGSAYQEFARGGLSKEAYEAKMEMEAPLRREVILRAICMAESNCQQFNNDGSVKHGEIDPDDTGMFQINKRVHADLIAETGLDPEKEADNIRLANIIYGRDGAAAWNASRDRWEKELKRLSPRLAKPFVLAILDVPTDEWSEEAYNPLIDETNITWGLLDRSKGGKCLVMHDRDLARVFPTTEYHDVMSPGVVQFKCTEPSAQMKVRIVPKT